MKHWLEVLFQDNDAAEYLEPLRTDSLQIEGSYGSWLHGRIKTLLNQGQDSIASLELVGQSVASFPPYSKLSQGAQILLVSGGARKPLEATVQRRWEEPARREDWKLELPDLTNCRQVDYTRELTEEERRFLLLGEIPRVMEDRWMNYSEGEWLFMHRSWGGDLYFAVRIANTRSGYSVVSAKATERGEAKLRWLGRLIDSRCKLAAYIWDL